MSRGTIIWAVHFALLAALWAAQYLLPGYHVTNLARIMVMAVFALGYNLAFGYTGLLSLGHALFFAAGLYAASLPIWHFGLTGGYALLIGTLGGGAVAGIVGLLALRTTGVAFMIVTMMFAQAGYLSILYFAGVTGGEDGFALPPASRVLWGMNLASDGPRYAVAFGLFAIALLASLWLIRSHFGRTMMAIRENEERSRLLGYSPFWIKLSVLTLSGIYAGAAGASYGLLFGYAGASFATIEYSILPLLYVLLGGAGTVMGPFVGAALMFYLIDQLSSLTSAWKFFVGLALVALILFAPKGILGWVRRHIWRDLP